MFQAHVHATSSSRTCLFPADGACGPHVTRGEKRRAELGELLAETDGVMYDFTVMGFEIGTQVHKRAWQGVGRRGKALGLGNFFFFS